MTAFYQAGAPPEKLNLFDASNPCPVSDEGRGTSTPDANLERWKTVRALIDDAITSPDSPLDDVIDRHTHALDPVEQGIVRRMALTAMRLLPDAPVDQVDLDPLPATIVTADGTVTASVAFQYGFDLPSGREIYRLKTGRSGSSELERAVVSIAGTIEGAASDLNVLTGEITALAAPEDPATLIDSAVEQSRSESSTPDPNPFCVTCRRVATCGSYPSGRRVLPSNCLTVAITKTDLSRLGQCERRVAWNRFHQIPRAQRDHQRLALDRGILFHDLITSAADGDPEAVLESVLSEVSPAERADYEQMFWTHSRMLEAESLTLRMPKRWAGTTFIAGEAHEMKAVTVLGEIDFTADDGAGLALVEIKTGLVSDGQIESDLYAVGVASWFRARGRDVPELTVHRHFVTEPEGVCDSLTYDGEGLERAEARLRAMVEPVFGWQRDRPSDVAPTFGEWCQSCEFETICRP